MKQILFNTEMVRTILDDRKTQTRRPIDWDISNSMDGDVASGYSVQTDDGLIDALKLYKYQSGDILYVRETFAKLNDEGHVYYEYKADTGDPYPGEWPQEEAKGNPDAPKWKSSRHMPKEAARLFLKVTNVRIERVPDISIKDIISEGLEGYIRHTVDDVYTKTEKELISEYQTLWDEIYESKGYGWDTNCWIWVIEFERCEKQNEN